MKKLFIPCIMLFALFSTCSSDDVVELSPNTDNNDDNPIEKQIKILSLGDSYTIGQSVCESCRFPIQLKDSLESSIMDSSIEVDIIAQTGWTTSDLQNAIDRQNPDSDYDFVSLLIGVNNQYQGRSFSVYEQEFPELLQQAISFANGNKERVIVVSIPDYAFTPFGQNSGNAERISQEIDRYNTYAKNKAEERDVTFVNITDITRKGLEDPSLVASDGLHPSERAYTEFVSRILPLVLAELN